MNIYFFICIIMSSSNSKVIKPIYPTKRWVTICKNSTQWYQNKTTKLTTLLKENIDVLYL